MSNLIGQTFLGSKFVQDTNSDYIKIDKVLVGESAPFAYKTIKNGDIGQLLKDCLKDNNVAVILYDWTGKVGYIKKGFELSDSSDSKTKDGFTTFIVKSKVSDKNNRYFDVAAPSPKPEPKPEPSPNPPAGKFRVNEFIKLNGSVLIHLKNRYLST